MRIGLISDIHGNLPALEAVLADVRAAGADQVICLGDVAVMGPQPRETVAALRDLGCPMVMGNTDAWLLDPHPHPPRDADTPIINAIEWWCAGQLLPQDLAFVRSFRPTVALSPGAGTNLLCFHGSPRSNVDAITATTPGDELDAMLAGAHSTLLAGGHTHTQLLRRHREMLLINPGSTGYPVELGPANDMRNPPWAEYALVTLDAQRLSIDLRRVPYDIAPLLRAARHSGMPHAEWWMAKWQPA